jgi:hypothetical protein
MTICAALFGWWRISGAVGNNSSLSAIRVFSIIVRGLAITAAIVVVVACCTAGNWKSTDPGHWFALLAVWEFLDEKLIGRLIHIVPFQSTHVAELVFSSVTFTGITIILFIGVCMTKWPIYWRIAVGVHIFDALNAAIWRLLFIADEIEWFRVPGAFYLQMLPIIGILAAVLLVVAVAIDIYKRERRNWPHWAGVLSEATHWFWIVKTYLR